ncbi:MAG: Uma2 family endonuclease [Isosphaeraceae bacterium]
MSTASVFPAIAELLMNNDRAVLHNVPWDVYMAMRDDKAHRHLRMDYFRGTLELMSPRYRHEKYTARLRQFVMKLAEVLDIPCTESGSTASRSEEEGAGKEADTSFYIAHEALIRDKEDIDLSVDPPPDLAIEVDDHNDSEGKLPIYAALRVPEVWRFDARTGVLWFGRLQDDGTYRPIARSECLPMLTPERVLEAMGRCKGLPHSRWGRVLQEWICGLTP